MHIHAPFLAMAKLKQASLYSSGLTKMFLFAFHSFFSVLYSVFLSYTLEGAVCNPYSVNCLSLLITRGQRESAHYTKRKKVCINDISLRLHVIRGQSYDFFVKRQNFFQLFYLLNMILSFANSRLPHDCYRIVGTIDIHSLK